MVKITKSIFFAPKDQALARKISIKSPNEFRDSIKRLMKNGLTKKEHRALVLARTRASVQLKRRNLSSQERKQFEMIAKMRIPRLTTVKKKIRTKDKVILIYNVGI